MTIQFEKVKRIVGSQVHIHETDLVLENGSFNVLLGATLAGKTSLIRLAAGLDKPTSGRVLVNGKEAHRVPLQRRNVGMVYQEFINYPSFTVYDNIASPLRLKKTDKKDLDRKVREAAAMLQLTPYLDRLPNELSGGQQQRLAIARALVKDTDLLLLDEPLINLDYKLREQLRDELSDIIGHRDMIVIYATTEPVEALILGGTTVVLYQGRILQHGPAEFVFHHPVSVEVARTVNNPPMNIINAEMTGNGSTRQVRLADGTGFAADGFLGDVPAGPFKLGFRASQVSIFPKNGRDIALTGRVELAELTGSETFVHLRQQKTSIVIHEKGTHPHELGREITFYLNHNHLFAFDEKGSLLTAPRI